MCLHCFTFKFILYQVIKCLFMQFEAPGTAALAGYDVLASEDVLKFESMSAWLVNLVFLFFGSKLFHC